MTSSAATSAFPADYPDRRPATAKARERAAVEKQARHLTRLKDDEDYRRRMIELLQRRRSGQTDLVQFEVVPNGGFDALVVSGELLVRREDLDDPATRELIADFRLEASTVTNTGDAVIRLTETETDPARTNLRGRMAEFAKEITRRKARAAFSYIVPLGVVIKGEGGPEPSAGGRPFPSVVIPAGPATAVAVIDTGVTAEQRGDGWLNGLADTGNEDPLDALPAPDGALDLAAGHGTFATGVLQQVAPTADIRVLRAMDSDGIGQESDIADLIVRAVTDGAKILSLSFGTQTVDDRGPLAMRAALDTAFAMDPELLVFAAAGNYADTRPCWPAAFADDFPNVIAVAALTGAGTPAPWSSHGPWVTCSTVGEGVVSTYVIGTEDVAVENPPDVFGPDSWASWTGTSFAVPQVAGAVARRCQEQPGLTPRKALDELLAVATPMPGYGSAVVILPGT